MTLSPHPAQLLRARQKRFGARVRLVHMQLPSERLQVREHPCPSLPLSKAQRPMQPHTDDRNIAIVGHHVGFGAHRCETNMSDPWDWDAVKFHPEEGSRITKSKTATTPLDPSCRQQILPLTGWLQGMQHRRRVENRGERRNQ